MNAEILGAKPTVPKEQPRERERPLIPNPLKPAVPTPVETPPQPKVPDAPREPVPA